MEICLDDLSSFQGSFSDINTLPNEILFEIFKNIECQETTKKYFKTISRVAKRWYACANETQTALTVSGFKASKVEGIVKRFGNLSSLNLSLLYDCSDEVLLKIGKNCPNLKELFISESYKPENGGIGLASVTSGCPKLESLSINGYSGPENALMTIGNNCKLLRRLVLRSSPSMSDSVVVSISKNCHKIEDLDFSFTGITDVSLKAIGLGMPRLTHVDLKHCKSISGEGIFHLATGCPFLKVLHLGIVEVGDKGLLAIGKNSKLLEELYLDYGWGKWGKLSCDAIGEVAKGCSKLRVLSLRGSKQVDDHVLQGLARGCPSLTFLDLHACAGVGNDGLEAVIKGCKQLETLVLSGTSVGGVGLSAVDGPLPKLQTLRMSGDLITDDLLKSISVNCKSLSELNLANCSQLSDDGLEHIVKGCKEMKVMSAKCSPLVKGTAFSALCPKLESVNVQGSSMADEGLALVAKNCKNVACLSLQGCSKLSPEAIFNCVKSSHFLKELNLVACTQVSRDQILSIIRHTKSLKTMRVSRPDSPQDEYTISKRHGNWNLPMWARSSCARLQLG